MKKIVALVLAMSVMMGVGPVDVWANANMIDDSGFNPICEDLDDEQKALAGCQTVKKDDFASNLQQIINVAISVIGIAAVCVIVFGGQRYISSAGDPQKIKQAKDMIMYAVIGLVGAMLSWMIIGFVASNINR